MMAPEVLQHGSGSDDAVGPRKATIWYEQAWGRWGITIFTALLIFGGWELYGRSVNRALFAPFTRTLSALYELIWVEGTLVTALLDSGRTLLAGFTLAVVVGVVVGVLMGRFRRLELVLDPYVSFLYALPMVVVIPLFIIWLGLGIETRVAIIFAISVVPVLLNTMAAAKEVDENLMDTARVNCATQLQSLRTVVLPSVLPGVMTGMQVGIGSALIGMILGEMLVVVRGLGGLVVIFSNRYHPHSVLAVLLVIVALSLSLTTFVGWLRRKVMPWASTRD